MWPCRLTTIITEKRKERCFNDSKQDVIVKNAPKTQECCIKNVNCETENVGML